MTLMLWTPLNLACWDTSFGSWQSQSRHMVMETLTVDQNNARQMNEHKPHLILIMMLLKLPLNVIFLLWLMFSVLNIIYYSPINYFVLWWKFSLFILKQSLLVFGVLGGNFLVLNFLKIFICKSNVSEHFLFSTLIH